MIDLYTWSTPNGRKISILLEELNVKYKVTPINIMKDEQFNENFLKISPNNKIPAILDNENNISMMESGAIMLYLAEKYKEFFHPSKVLKNILYGMLFGEFLTTTLLINAIWFYNGILIGIYFNIFN